MCRFTLYLGPQIRLSSLLIDPEHSLIRQSSHAKEREEPLNGDGFGVGWYAHDLDPEPAVFRSITPAWNNRNLHNLTRVVASDCILAHVRAATQASGVNDANCHPFRFGRYLFMHNGDIGNFRLVRRRLLADVCDEAFSNVYGSTDSEHFFAVLIDELLKSSQNRSPLERIASAMTETIRRVIEVVSRYGDAEACYFNCAIADGDHAVVSRFSTDTEEGPPTLYYLTRQLYEKAAGANEASTADYAPVIVSSERLTADDAWNVIPPNSLVLLARNRAPQIRSIADLAARAGHQVTRRIRLAAHGCWTAN